MPDAGFHLVAPYTPTGDQPAAIETIVSAFSAGQRQVSLLGVTGSGKTFTMANVITRLQQPTLVLSHNKTLAAQLYSEFRGFFPDNAVEYFVSYYDYYQPEAYLPGKDLYIEKDASINPAIDQLRLSATRSLLARRDVIVVASVSSIYGLGSPTTYQDLTVSLRRDEVRDRDTLLAELVAIHYLRGDVGFARGRFRVRGDVVEVWPAYEDTVVRIEFFGDTVEALATVDPLTGEIRGEHRQLQLYPAKHFVVDAPTLEHAITGIEAELADRYRELRDGGHLLEAERLLSRTRYDLEMLREVGYCSGIENYSRYLSGRAAGLRPWCLFDFFPPDFLTIVDESHVTLPQLRGMYAGDRSRKETLVTHGFRLPSALDNRPMRFDEWEAVVGRVLYASATLGDYETAHQEARAEQLVRPTGLVDPPIEVRPTTGQVDDLITAVREQVTHGRRSLITTITKRLAEDLAEYLHDAGIPTAYLHSDLDAMERVEILGRLRDGGIHCLIGVNLLREGLDLPEVGLVAILDADLQGFLRSQQSLIQTMGRAARNVAGTIILYAETMSPAMRDAIEESRRRRDYQLAYNATHGIVPRSTIRRDDRDDFATQLPDRRVAEDRSGPLAADDVVKLRQQMLAAAEALEFEEAARLRDLIHGIEGKDAGKPATTAGHRPSRHTRHRR